MNKGELEIGGKHPGFGVRTVSFRPGNRDRRRTGFAVAPILYVLGLVGVGAAVLFSGYSQILRTNVQVTNNLATKNDLNGNATTLAATSVLSADTSTLCPPQGGHASSGCAAVPTMMTAIGSQAQLPANAGTAGSTGSPAEVGIFTAGSGVKQLDAYGHYYIYCRWENPTTPGNGAAFSIISAGPSGNLQTKCGDTTAQGDNLMVQWPVTMAINRSAVWQATTSGGSTTQVQFGQTGSQVVVDAHGNVTIPGTLGITGATTLTTLSASGSIGGASGSFSGTLTASAVNASSGTFSGALSAGSGTISGTLGVTGALTAGSSTLNALTVTNAASVGGTLGVTGATTLNALTAGSSTLNALTVTNTASVGGTLGVSGATTLGSTLATSGNTTIGGTLGVTGATTLNALTAGSSTLNALTVTNAASVGGTLGVTGNLSGSTATFSGAVSAASFSGSVGGGSINWGSAIVPLANGGTGYAASSTLDLLAHLGGTNASNLTSGTIAASLISAGEITSAMMAAPGATTAGPYYQVSVDASGRVVSGSGALPPAGSSMTDGAGETITLDSTNGITFTTNSLARAVINRSGNMVFSALTGQSLASLDLSGRTDALSLPSGTTAQRPSPGVNGMLRYNSTGGVANIEGYVNGAWSSLVTSGGGQTITSGVVLGTSAAATNPQRSGDATTGLFSPAASTVAVSGGGIEIQRWTTSGVGIGTATPANELDVNGAAAIGTYAGTAGPSNGLIVSGSVGIGTSAPAYVLDIAGGDLNVATGQYYRYNAVPIAYGITAGNNYFFGNSGNLTMSGSNNTASGMNALHSNTSGADNTANGMYALYNNTTGGFNTASGMQALYTHSTGSYNTASGYQALYYDSGSTGNTATGYQALLHATNNYNAAFGYAAGATITSGTNNVVVGPSVASTTLTTGSNNILIGTSSAVDTPAAGTSNSLNIGNAIYATSLGSTPLVGIGSAAPVVSLDVSQRTDALALPVGTTANQPTGGNLVNGEIRYNSSTPAVEAYVNGAWASLATTGGGSGVILGTSASATNPQRSGDATPGLFSPAASTVAISAGGTEEMRVNTTGVGIGSTSPAYKLDVAGGDIRIASTQAIRVGSAVLAYGDYPNHNYFFAEAGTLPIAGSWNIAIGPGALQTNNTGNTDNIAIGYQALASGKNATGNVAVGYAALQANTSGSTNTATGMSSLYYNTTGGSNTANGQGALQANTTGSNNTGVGASAGSGNTTGSYNTAVGSNALPSSAGSNNTAIGYQALYSTTTGYNVAVGYGAGYSITTGTYNVIIGYLAATNTLTTGSNNIIIGTSNSVTTPAAGTSHFLNIGNAIYATGLDSTPLIGIGSTSPQASLDVSQRTDAIVLPVGTTANRPTAANGMIRYNSTTPAIEGYVNGAWASLLAAGGTISSGVTLGASASATNPQRSGQAGTGLFSPATSTVATAIAGTEMTRVTSTGLGIGSTSPAYSLDVAGGDINVASGQAYRYSGAIIAYGNLTYKTYFLGGAGNTSTTGYYDIASGYRALYNNTSGTGNTATGYEALYSNQTSGNATAEGYFALYLNTAGSNTATGAGALHNNTSGGNNTAIGAQALNSNSTGNNNIAAGLSALTYSTGSNNTALGYIAGTAITGGSNNVVIGPSVATTVLQTGSSNILIGTSSSVDTPASSTSNFLDIGNAIYATGLGGTPLVGIGSTSPQASLDVSQRTDAIVLPVGTTANRPTAATGMIRYNSSTPAIEGYINGAWTSLATGGGSVTLGTSTSATSPQRSGDATTGEFSPAASTVAVSIGGTEMGRWTSTGLGIGTTNPGYSLDVNGDVNVRTGQYYRYNGTPIAFGIGVANYFFGDAGNLTITGHYNTAAGFQALYNNSTGSSNTAVGVWALYNNSTSPWNTALGYEALYTNTTGTGNNTALGFQALYYNSTGYSNTATGLSALYANTSGTNNTATGVGALTANTSGINNTAIGVSALGTDSTGNYNTATGMNALLYNTGSYNTATGYAALYPSTGSYNTALGYYTGYALTTGTNNTIIGYSVASITLSTGSNNILIGTSNAVDTPAAGTSNFLNIGGAIYATGLGSGPLVGIGTMSPANRLDVSGAVAIGTYAGTAGPSGGLIVSGNVGIGTTSPAVKLQTTTGVDGLPLTSGTTQTYGALRLRGGGTGLLDVGVDGSTSWLQATDATNLGLNYTLVLNPNGGNVGIGTTAPAYGLDIYGTGVSSEIRANASSGDSAFYFALAGTNKYKLYRDTTGGYVFNSPLDTYPLAFGVNNSISMWLANGGNVGIGTTSPSTALQVNGTITATSVTGLNTPVNASDAATKAYVDSKAGGATWHSQTFTGSGTWSNPGVNSVGVLLVGGGGGGGAGVSYNCAYGAGGGGGGAIAWMPNWPVTGNLTITIGSGGAGGWVTNYLLGNNGSNGGTTTVTGGPLTLAAPGGSGGQGVYYQCSGASAGGAGGGAPNVNGYSLSFNQYYFDGSQVQDNVVTLNYPAETVTTGTVTPGGNGGSSCNNGGAAGAFVFGGAGGGSTPGYCPYGGAGGGGSMGAGGNGGVFGGYGQNGGNGGGGYGGGGGGGGTSYCGTGCVGGAGGAGASGYVLIIWQQ